MKLIATNDTINKLQAISIEDDATKKSKRLNKLSAKPPAVLSLQKKLKTRDTRIAEAKLQNLINLQEEDAQVKNRIKSRALALTK
jgi:UDP-glucose 6-dehydrogenase